MEVLPFLGGLVAAIVGGALVADAALSEEPFTERRRAARPERNRVGQGCLGGSLVCTALVLLSGGGSPFAIAATFIGTALLAAGVVLNWRYLVDLINGPSSRAPVSAGNDARSDDFDGRPAPAYGWPVSSDD